MRVGHQDDGVVIDPLHCGRFFVSPQDFHFHETGFAASIDPHPAVYDDVGRQQNDVFQASRFDIGFRLFVDVERDRHFFEVHIDDTLFGDGIAFGLDAGDVNNNEVLDITDAIRILAFLFQQGQAPEEPFPKAGVDPDGGEGLGCESGAG